MLSKAEVGFSGESATGRSTLAGMLPSSQTRKVEQAPPNTYTDENGAIQSSGGRGLRRTDPTPQPTTPLSEVAAQVRSGHVDAKA